MSTVPRDGLERAFPRREWAGGLGRFALLWSLLSGLLLLLLLFLAGLWLAVLVDQGRVDLSLTAAETARFEALTGLAPLKFGEAAPGVKRAPAGNENEAGGEETPVAPVDPGAATAIEHEILQHHHYEDAGLLLSVWRSRDTWWGGVLAGAYRQFPVLQANQSAALTILAAMAVVWLLRMATIGQLRNACRHAALEVAARMRRQLYRQAIRVGTEDLDGRRSQTAVDLFVTETERIRNGLFELLYRGTRYPLELLVVIITACSVELLLSAQWVLLSILTVYIVRRSQSQVDHVRRLAADRSQQALRDVSSALRNARVVRGFSIDAPEYESFQERLQRYNEQARRENRIQDDPLWLRTLILTVAAALGLLLLYVLSAKILAHEVSVPGGAVFLTAYLIGIRSLLELRRLYGWHREVNTAFDPVWRFVDELPGVGQTVGAKFVEPLAKTVHFEHVSYAGADKSPLLDRLDLQITAGRTYAILSVDPLESKAFAALLPRFIEPDVGRVLFDGEDIAWGTLESIRAEVQWVSADDPPLPGTIVDNIRAQRPEITLTQATEAAKEARAHSFISRLPQGYETVLTGRDDPLDAGQRFRLSLARALVRNPAVLILEEPADEMDDDTKTLLDDAYSRICQGRTVFFLPSRLSTVRRADDVLLLHQGRVEAYGPQTVLVKESRLYQHWEYLRFHEFRHPARSADAKP